MSWPGSAGPAVSGLAVSGLATNAQNSTAMRVGTPLATWAVIAAILPLAFVGGLMGPYMRPIPIGAGAAMIFSLLIAFIVTPWAAVRILKRSVVDETEDSESNDGHGHGREAVEWPAPVQAREVRWRH